VEITCDQIWAVWRICQHLPTYLGIFLCGLLTAEPYELAHYADERLHLVEAGQVFFLLITGHS